jgi:hypothetical protein
VAARGSESSALLLRVRGLLRSDTSLGSAGDVSLFTHGIRSSSKDLFLSTVVTMGAKSITACEKPTSHLHWSGKGYIIYPIRPPFFYLAKIPQRDNIGIYFNQPPSDNQTTVEAHYARAPHLLRFEKARTRL